MRENDISNSWVSMTGKSEAGESRGSLGDGEWWPLDEVTDRAMEGDGGWVTGDLPEESGIYLEV